MEHAFLSPSGAKLDIHCPGNRQEQAKYSRESSVHSAKGTGLHKLGSACLNRGHNADQYLGWWCGELATGADFLMKADPGDNLPKGTFKFKIATKEADNVQTYLDCVRDTLSALPGAQLLVEQRVHIAANSWGTADAQVCQSFGSLYCVDYKNGHTFVDVETPQLKLYLIGMLGKGNPNEYQSATAVIVQPNAMGEKAVRSHTYSIEELMTWYTTVYSPAAKLCIGQNPQRIAGAWCKDGWCNARSGCPTLAAFANEVTQGMFSDVPAEQPQGGVLPDPINMAPAVIARVIENMSVVKDWMDSVYKYEYGKALHNTNTWGKLVAGQNSRSWAVAEQATMRLTKLLHGNIYGKKLVSPSQAEAALKDMGYKPKQIMAELDGMIQKTEGKPKLVHVEAKGKPVSVIDNMFDVVE
jgi:hypothetical protein